MIRAVRTLPGGEAAESRESPTGRGWFGVVPEAADPARRLDLGEGVTALLDQAGMVTSVSYDRGKVTDSVLFYVLRSVSFEAAG